MIISVCGFGSTGSSAVSDYISEFSSVQVLDSIEFDLCYRPDGLCDLYYHIKNSQDRTYSISYAIERFKHMLKFHILDYYSNNDKNKKKKLKLIFDEFINSIISVRWYGFQNENYSKTKSIFQSIVLGHFFNSVYKKNRYPLSEISLCDKDIDLLKLFKTLVNNVLLFLGMEEGKTVILDQAFSGNNPQASFCFFDNPLAIIIDRDPRDLYIFANEVLVKKKFFKYTMFMPTKSVDDFILYYKLIRKNQPYLEKNNSILRLHFEDLIYNYDNTSKLINSFCGLNADDRYRKQFDPNMSIANTQLFKKFPKYQKAIDKITDELKDYLYDFPNIDIDVNKEMFSGKSPLRREK